MTYHRSFWTSLFMLSLTLSSATHAWADGPKGFDKASCSYNGPSLHGRVQMVDSFPGTN